MKQFLRRQLRLAAFLASAPLVAHAGDGPYVGIEGGANWESRQNLLQNGNDIDSLHFDTGWAAGLVGGYSFASGLRPEFALDHRRNALQNDAHGLDAGGFENADSVFANLWYDFKAPSGLFSVVHPYLGLGVGGVRFDTRGVTIGGVGVNDYYATKIGYQGGAGVGFDLTPRLTLSADYRYLQSNRGSFDFDAAGPVQARYRAQSGLLGLRYSFGEEPAAPAPPPSPPPPPIAAVAPPPPPPPPPPPCKPPAGFKVDADCHIIEQSVVVRAVDFEFNSTQLTIPAQQTLDEVANALKTQPELNVEIQGHTDSVGAAAYNLKLSQKRADAVRTYLIGKGVNASALMAKGFGKTKPLVSNDTAEGRAQNRRVEFEVTNGLAHVNVVNQGASNASTEAAQQGEPSKTVKRHHKKKAAAAPAAQ